MRCARALVGLLLAAGLAGCGAIPRDPDGTLERVRTEQVLRVGASASPERVVIEGDEVGGTEAVLVTGFARALDADIDWTLSGETELIAAMERGELDLIIGGLHADSPWADKVSLTRPYASSRDPEGETVTHVMAVPLGENALLVRLERYLDEVSP